MQLSLCIVVALFAGAVLAAPAPDVSHIVSPDFDVVEAILVHEEHDDVGVEGRAANVPAEILNIFTKILENNVPKIINGGGDALAARALSVDDAPEMAAPAAVEEMKEEGAEVAAPAEEMVAPDMPEDMAKEMEA